jgi:hypothetical protein
LSQCMLWMSITYEHTVLLKKNFEHTLNYSARDTTDKVRSAFQHWHNDATLGRLGLP